MGAIPNRARDRALRTGKAPARTPRTVRTIPPDNIPHTEQALRTALVRRMVPALAHTADTADTGGMEDTADKARARRPHCRQEDMEPPVEEGRWEDKAGSTLGSRWYLLARPLSARIVVRDDRRVHNALAVLRDVHGSHHRGIDGQLFILANDHAILIGFGHLLECHGAGPQHFIRVA